MLMKEPFTGKLCHVRHLLQPLRNQLLEEKNTSKEHPFVSAAMPQELTN
jgi:hypothetical protein